MSLRDIWFRPGAFAYSRDFHLSDLAGFCRSCQYAETCRGGCLSMRSCEGGRDNPFCYHRVATLAERKAHSRSRYTPVALAPAALLALLGVGCGAGTDLYGCAPPGCDNDAGAGGTANDAASDAPDDHTIAPAYGLPWEGGAVDAYGVPEPDAGSVDLYGVAVYDMPPKGLGSKQP